MSKCAVRNCKGIVAPRYGFIRELPGGYEQKYSCGSCGAIYTKLIKYGETENAAAMPAK